MKSRETVPLPEIASVDNGIQALLTEMSDWLDEAYERYYDMPWQGGHDEGTFLTAWKDYYALTGDERVMALAMKLRDGSVEWGKTNWRHGYHRRNESHHGTEHHAIFLKWLREIKPEDEITNDAIIDGAHHIGNWIDGIPRWYDRERRRFVSMHLGTEEIGEAGTCRRCFPIRG